MMEEGLDNLMYQSNKNGVMKISSKLCKDMHFKTTRAGSRHLETRREGAIQPQSFGTLKKFHFTVRNKKSQCPVVTIKMPLEVRHCVHRSGG